MPVRVSGTLCPQRIAAVPLIRGLLVTALPASPLLSHANLPTLEPGLKAQVEQDGENYRLRLV